MPGCPECKGSMRYNNVERKYVCRGCGVAMTMDEIWVLKDKKNKRPDDDSHKDDYLQWWLSDKK